MKTRKVTLNDVKNDFVKDVGDVTQYHFFLAAMSIVCPTIMPLTIPLSFFSIPFEIVEVSLHTMSNLGNYAKNSVSELLNSATTSTKEIFNAMNINPENYKQKQSIAHQVDSKKPVEKNKQPENNVLKLNDYKKLDLNAHSKIDSPKTSGIKLGN